MDEDDRNESCERMKYQRGTVVSPRADLETDDMRQKLADPKILVTKPNLLLLVQFVQLFWALAFLFQFTFYLPISSSAPPRYCLI